MAGMTWRIVRALQYLQWRLAINNVTHSRQRGELENLSRLADFILPIILGIVLIPLTLVLTAGGGMAGYFLADATHDPRTIAMVLGFGLCLPCVWVLFRPFRMLASRKVERNDLVRLLPSPRWLLHHLELFRALHEPVFLAFVPGLLLLPLGILVGGKVLLAFAALAAGLLIIAFLACTATLIALAVQLLLRNRKRGEVAGLAFFLIASIVGLLPQFFAHNHEPRRSGASSSEIERPMSQEQPDRSLGDLELPRAVRALPPFLYGDVLGRGATGDWPGAGLAFCGLFAQCAVIYSVSIPIYRRLTVTPAVSSSTRKDEVITDATGAIPFVPGAIAAVALTSFRVLIRTVRGKVAVAMPIMIAVVISSAARQVGADGIGFVANPLVVGAFTVLVSMAHLGAFTTNQFAVMGQGLILEFLQPIAPRTLLRGRFLAATAMFVVGVTPGLLALFVLLPHSTLSLLPTLFFAALSVNFLAFPVAALLAMVFPKLADLSSVGRGSQPHAAAGMLQLLGVMPAALPSAALIALALLVFHSQLLAAILTAGWTLAAFCIALGAMRLLEPVLLKRRENLALVAVGK